MNNLFLVKKFRAHSMTIVLTLAILLSIVGSAMAQENRDAPGKSVSTMPSQGQGPTDPAEMEAFLDDLLGKEMEEYHIPGAAVAVVKDGELFFTKGYGYADIEKGIQVDPEQTIFSVGSISKTFTWTAVMQLVEQGKLDLDEDVNTYLDFRIPDTYPGSITLKHLLTHTSGFEQRLLGSFVSDPNDLMPVREFMISYMPARVRPPGVAAGYSNYNAMLARYIVARVSGQPYDQYIQEHIFDPLGMVHSTAQWPIRQTYAHLPPRDTRMPMVPSRHSPITWVSREDSRLAQSRPVGSPACDKPLRSTATDAQSRPCCHPGSDALPRSPIAAKRSWRPVHTNLAHAPLGFPKSAGSDAYE